MHIVGIKASDQQLSKLRNGHRVRLVNGKGFNLLVNPENYDLITQSFDKKKGIDIKLTQEEIDMNRSFGPGHHEALAEEHPHLSGRGIFGKRFDKSLKKAGIKKIAYQVGDAAKPLVKQAIKQGLDAGVMALDSYAPEMAPFTQIGANALNKQIDKKLDGKGFKQLKNDALNKLHSNILSGKMDAMSIKKRYAGEGLYAGHGMGAGYGLGLGLGSGMRGRGLGGNIDGHNYKGTNSPMGFEHPALMSQPDGVNFNMNNMLPPGYQLLKTDPINTGVIFGAGLYA